MRRFYPVLLLLLSMFPATFGQTNHSHNDIKQFENKLVRVFEWVLDGRFTSAQRVELSRLIESSVQSGNATDLKSLQDIVKLNDLIDTIPAEREAEVRAGIQQKILEGLRKQPNDPTAKLLLSVYDNAHQTNSQASRYNAIPPQQNQGVPYASSAAFPSELIGEWQARRGSGSSYYNPNSGSFGAPNGTIDSYKFFGDGRYEHAMLMQNSLYNCTIRVFGRETGRTLVNGDTMTITPGPGTLEYTDTCRSQMNSKKSTQMEEKKWQWQIGRDEYGVKLCVRDTTGASACYYRQ
jgi:hypothetical protein